MLQIGKYILAAILLLGGLVALAMTLCGAVFTFQGMNASGAWILLISVPSVGIGVALMHFVAKGMHKIFNDAPAKDDSQNDLSQEG